jgi:O-antigen ligase
VSDVTSDDRSASRPPKRRSAGLGGLLPYLPTALPALAVAFLGFRQGGFFPASPGIVAAVLGIALVLRITLSARPLAGVSAPVVVLVAALALLAVLELASAGWSHAPARALLDFDRTLAYVLGAATLGCLTWTPRRLAVATWLLLAGIVVVCVAALLSRLAPDVLSVSPGPVADRLSYPLTYWNAMGVFAAIGVVLALGLTTSAREPRAVRLLAAAALPVAATALLLTLSRGAILAGLAGVVVVLAAGRGEGAIGGLAAAAAGAVLPVLAVLGADAVTSDRYATAAGQAEGHHVALILGLGVLLALLVRALALPLDRRTLAWTARRARRTGGPGSRARRLAWPAAGALAVLVVVVVAARSDAVHRQYSQFVHGGFTTTGGPDRLLAATSNGRLELWRVSLQGFRDHPLHGTGAGTFQTHWTRERRVDQDVVDAHSLYIEVLGELGLPGLLLVVTAIGLALAGFARRARGPSRAAPAALLAAGVTWALHAGVDWDWEMPATGFWIFSLGALALARPRGAGAARSVDPRRIVRIAAGLACLLLIVTPLMLVRSDAELSRAGARFAAGDCPGTVDAALASIGAVGSRPQPYELLGYCDARLGYPALAERALGQATRRDPDWWATWYGLALVRGAAGHDPRPAAARALRLNPREPLTIAAVRAFRRGGARRWPVVARRLPLPGQ